MKTKMKRKVEKEPSRNRGGKECIGPFAIASDCLSYETQFYL